MKLRFHDKHERVVTKKSIRHIVYDALMENEKIGPKELIELCWGDDSEGGPLDPYVYLGIAIRNLRKEGLMIDSIRECQPDGSTLTFYRLRR